MASTALLSEYEDVLARAALFRECRLSEAERFELLDIFLAQCTWCQVYFNWRPNVPDETDNHVIELAVAGGTEVIVTRNLRDLARMELCFPHLRVLSPEVFWQEI